MATSYIISATSLRPARTMANKKSAITEADARAREVKFFEAVTITTTATGKLVHETKVIKPEPAPQPAAPKAPKAKAPRKSAKRYTEPQVKRGQVRPALDKAMILGWEVLYDKPVKGYQVWRGTASGNAWALHCLKHGNTRTFPTLKVAGEFGGTGGWCSHCEDELEAVELLDNDLSDNVDGLVTEDELKALAAINGGGNATQVWDPNAAAEAAELDTMRRLEELGLVELAVNDPDNIWVYLTDLGERALARK
jgi:hypothetical protein